MKVFVVAVIQIVALVTLATADYLNESDDHIDPVDPYNMTGIFGEQAMAQLDKNKDGSVTPAEWRASSNQEGSLFPGISWGNITSSADDDCDLKLNAKELGTFLNLFGGYSGGFTSQNAVGDDIWKTLLANHDTDKDKKISLVEYLAYKSQEGNKCALPSQQLFDHSSASSLTAAVSMLGLVLMAKILF